MLWRKMRQINLSLKFEVLNDKVTPKNKNLNLSHIHLVVCSTCKHYSGLFDCHLCGGGKNLPSLPSSHTYPYTVCSVFKFVCISGLIFMPTSCKSNLFLHFTTQRFFYPSFFSFYLFLVLTLVVIFQIYFFANAKKEINDMISYVYSNYYTFYINIAYR